MNRILGQPGLYGSKFEANIALLITIELIMVDSSGQIEMIGYTSGSEFLSAWNMRELIVVMRD